MQQERRIHPRVKCPASFRILIDEHPEEIGQVLNISMGGVTFIFPEKLQHKEVLDFIITCPVTPFNLNIHGEIIWSKNFSGNDSFISGAVFPYLSEEEVAHLRRVISIFSSEMEQHPQKNENQKKPA